jgi:hypothetical protein
VITFHQSPLRERNGLAVAATLDGAPVAYAEVLRRLRTDATFRSQWNNGLAAIPYVAFRWETPPITNATASRPFEFVALDSPGLAHSPDPSAFAEHFARAPAALAVEFTNLGKNAILVAPTPRGAPTAYGHLAAFVRQAAPEQQSAFWTTVGEAMARRLGAKPVWLSTAGAGVPWLHVRLDDSPKYYGHAPFRNHGPQR